MVKKTLFCKAAAGTDLFVAYRALLYLYPNLQFNLIKNLLTGYFWSRQSNFDSEWMWVKCITSHPDILRTLLISILHNNRNNLYYWQYVYILFYIHMFCFLVIFLTEAGHPQSSVMAYDNSSTHGKCFTKWIDIIRPFIIQQSWCKQCLPP